MTKASRYWVLTVSRTLDKFFVVFFKKSNLKNSYFYMRRS